MGLQLGSGRPGVGEVTLAESQSESFRVWLQQGAPWNKDSRHACYMTESGGPVVRVVGCREKARVAIRNGAACLGCIALANSPTFVTKVANWAFRIDLVRLLHATYCGDEANRRVVLDEMSTAQYKHQSNCTIDIASVREADYETLHRLATKTVLSINFCNRNQACVEFLQRWMDWLPRTRLSTPHTDLIHSRMKGLLASTYSERDQSGDAKLASMILGGALSGHAVIRTLVSALLSKCEKELAGKKKICASSLPSLGLDHADVCEAVFTLTSVANQRDLLKMFGFSSRAKPRVPWRNMIS